MGIIGSFDQLHVYSHSITALLHAAFYDVGHTKLLCYLGQVFGHAFVMLGRCARDHLEIGDLRSQGQNLVLDSVGKVGVGFFFAQVFEG